MLLPSLETLLWTTPRRDSCSAVKMNVQTLLNTNRSSAASPEPRNMQYEQPSVMPPHHDLTSPSNYALQNALYEPPPPQPQPQRVKTESEGNPPTPQSSESSRFPSHAPSVQHGYPPQSHSQALPTDYRYDSPGFAQPHLPLLPNGYNNASTDEYTRSQLQSLQHPVQPAPQPIPTRTPLVSSSLPKSFACSTCNKGFARRSDLARHGEIIALCSTGPTDMAQNGYTAESDRTSATIRVVGSSSYSGPP